MPLMEAFEQGQRYVFVPERAAKPLSAIALMPDGRAMIELSAASIGALNRKTKELEKVLGKPHQILPLSEGAALRLLFAGGKPETLLGKLRKAGYLTRDDAEHALLQYERLEVKPAQPAKAPTGLVITRQDNARVSV